MISSLIPGLRDLRTPVVVGALWCAVVWMLVRWQLADESRAVTAYLDDSPILQWRDHLLLTLTATFVAYVVGVAATLDPQRGLTASVINRFDRRSQNAKTFAARSALYVNGASKLLDQAKRDTNAREEFDAHAQASKFAAYRTLKTRLMRDRIDLYLVCDKLDSEAALRMSSAVPLLAGAITGYLWLDQPLILIIAALAVVLFVRGCGRAFETRDLARDAVTAGLVDHPLIDVIDKFPFKESPEPADMNVDQGGVS